MIFVCSVVFSVSSVIAQRTKDMLRVVDQASPGFRMAAAGFSSQLLLLPSMLGRLCQGSMHTNLGMLGLLHSKV